MTRSMSVAASAVGAGLACSRITQRWRHWGASAAEIDAVLPGDDLLAEPTLVTTRAVDIDAPPEEVWPWLVQMGQDRGGLYSYDWLENLFGLDFRNAEEVVPEWQQLEVGDLLRMAPESAGPDAGFIVVSIEPLRSIVTVAGDPGPVPNDGVVGPLPDGATWVFVLEPIDGGRTRLIVRLRARFGFAPPLEWLGVHCLEPVHFVMERKMLLGIRERAVRVG